MSGRPIRPHASGGQAEPYACMSCGAPSYTGVKPCTCATGLGYLRSDPNKTVEFVDLTPTEGSGS